MHVLAERPKEGEQGPFPSVASEADGLSCGPALALEPEVDEPICASVSSLMEWGEEE